MLGLAVVGMKSCALRGSVAIGPAGVLR